MESILAIAIGVLIVLIIIVLFYFLLLGRNMRYLFAELLSWITFWR